MKQSELKQLIREELEKTLKQETQSPIEIKGIDAFNKIYSELPQEIKTNSDVLEVISREFYNAAAQLTDF
jgi:uncharacterized protein with von Willebrand factor type A (vWA) domain